MSSASFNQAVPYIGLQTRSSDNGQVLRVMGWSATGAVGDYFGAAGVMTPVEADATNLRGASEVGTQRLRVSTPASGLYTWTFDTPFAGGVVPVIECCAEGPDPQNNVTVNAQVEGTPTNTSCKIRVTRTTATVVALIGLTILSINTPVSTVLHLTARAP